MKLLEFLNKRMEETPEFEDQAVKIGSQIGYFYYGTVKNFIKSAVEYDRKIEQFFTRSANSAERKYESVLNNPPTISDYAKDVLQTDGARFCIRDYEKMLCSWFKTARKKYRAMEKAAERKDGTKRLAEREVLDNRMADEAVDEGVEIIIVEGYEQGGLWMSSEAEEKGEFTIGESEEEESVE